LEGFDYQIDSLNAEGKPNELDQVFTELLHSSHAQSDAAFRLAQSIVPILKFVVCVINIFPKPDVV
jgi:hypothetical protein